MSDRRERLGDPVESLLVALQGHQSNIWTAIPAKVVKVDRLAAQNTVHVQPTIMGMYRGPTDQEFTPYKMPLLLDCPVHFPGGGTFVLTFPVVVGDEGLVIIASRCIDQWWSTGANDNVQAELRMHDLSDGFFLPGFRSRPNAVPGLNLTDVQLRSLDNLAHIGVKPDHTVEVITTGDVNVQCADCTVSAANVTVVASTEIIFSAPLTIVNGNLTVNGDIVGSGHIEAPIITGDTDVRVVVAGTPKSIGTHHHTGGTLTGGLTGNNV